MFWLWFTLVLLSIAAIDGYFTRRRLARQAAGRAPDGAAKAADKPPEDGEG